MAILALAVSVLLTAALAVAGCHFYRRLDRRFTALSALISASSSPERYAIPQDQMQTFAASLPSEMDVVGAWAAEQEARGVNVSDEEIDSQRRMWAQEG